MIKEIINIGQTIDWGLTVGVISLIITAVMFLRVQKISIAKKEEKTVISRALNLRELLDKLRKTQSQLLKCKQPDINHINLSLATLNKELETSLRIVIPETENINELKNIKVISDGYWTDAFASESIKKATNLLSIVTWRNTRCFCEGMLSNYISALQDNPKLIINIHYISPDGDDFVYSAMENMLTVGTAKVMRKQQRLSKDMALSYFNEMLNNRIIDAAILNRIQLYEYNLLPHLHCIVVDNEVNWGINFFMNSSIGATTLLDKAYIQTNSDSSFGEKVLEQIRILKKYCEAVKLRGINNES